MQHGLQTQADPRIRERLIAHPSAVQRAVGGQRPRAKFALDRRHGGALRGGQRARDLVGIDKSRAPLRQHVRHAGLARTDTARETNLEHTAYPFFLA
ncbi:hypothetical protein D3C87_1739880 [compost metagenome]